MIKLEKALPQNSDLSNIEKSDGAYVPAHADEKHQISDSSSRTNSSLEFSIEATSILIN
ncbi:14182_t:CDS:2 [Entrophospora sp. SA101]|nr:15456_t:CDS:2 [Entrophospora sp. SA101]CAJ0637200.1 1078_t:CDS:2 [Entrophospora sp. SA101]CAJ0764872.1 14182_t:CDS:2 [Entrophospora sp. SA101]CAJ0843103.1 3398_t:CDS:2 [Entrophospora sp. SA101]CAJ0866993.1 662_t:CDS:2 [Entrophospora sp. SA101]